MIPIRSPSTAAGGLVGRIEDTRMLREGRSAQVSVRLDDGRALFYDFQTQPPITFEHTGMRFVLELNARMPSATAGNASPDGKDTATRDRNIFGGAGFTMPALVRFVL